MTLSAGSPKLTTNTKRAIAKYGEAVCKESFSMTKSGDGGRTIGFDLNLTTRQADAAIAAGRELAGIPPAELKTDGN